MWTMFLNFAPVYFHHHASIPSANTPDKTNQLIMELYDVGGVFWQ